ncbi:hypothetical protein [Flammeovirga kamogawensis]|uniref:DUF4625 domain-containing protein n=1 Tax=Flammeovirga kamogawensis TaxID=373891 RepID=A0ABX8GU12_9BACT|nr:hypothetical protein [Flammeovirga kamogawensis]MBB6462532.1 hypothetical protein [Flammeovirga kamogawensis]QWG06732.1 hypothetical protein KM029_15690 [Flammeovirga kamogawensis]TRX68555.1 hypothetical protein EO216_10685 [Flammeovirga kamogawensis]
MKKSLQFLVSVLFIALMSACGGRNLNDVIPKSTTFEFSAGISPTVEEGNFTSSLITTIYVPGKVSTLDVSVPFENDFLQINLARKTRSAFEEQVHDILLKGKHYLNVKGNDEVKVHFPKKLLNELKVGEYIVSFSVLDEKNDFKNQDLKIKVVAKK